KIFTQEYRDVDYGSLFDYLSNMEFENDGDEAMSYISKLKSNGEDISEPELVLEAEILEVRYLNDRNYTSTDESITVLLEILEKGSERDMPKICSKAIYLIYKRYWNQGDYDAAFQYLHKLEGLLENLSNDEFLL